MITIDAKRLDRLVDAIGELVILQSMVSQSPELRTVASPQFARQLDQLDKITRELQQLGTSLRMIPVRSTFQRMARLVRDLAKKAGKQVEFVMSGEDTELDKSVVDVMGDPLIHLLRNAVDHGIEAHSEDREEKGKGGHGRVELRAFHKGSSIFIEVEDDGRGLDRQAILSKAREKGLVSDGEAMADRDVLDLIFEPGFSTAKVVTEVSGRGVGLDVVRRRIETLRGHVELYSEPGRGTVFSIQLPLTLAMIDGMVVRVGLERYIIPVLSIVRSIRPESKDVATIMKKGEMVVMDGELVPLLRLAHLFGMSRAGVDISEGIVVIVEDGTRKVGLLADELMGQQQIVMKPLSEPLEGVPGISGGAIMPDGRVGLILDVGGLVKLGNCEASLEEVV